MPPMGRVERKALYGVSDVPTHRAADSGQVDHCWYPHPTWRLLVMVTAGKALRRVSLSAVPVAAGSGAVYPLLAYPPPHLHHLPQTREKTSTTQAGVSLQRCC